MDEFVNLRRALDANPELSGEEQLRSWLNKAKDFVKTLPPK
jgi:hypothetical protein